jgi:hypothetical protein
MSIQYLLTEMQWTLNYITHRIPVFKKAEGG